MVILSGSLRNEIVVNAPSLSAAAKAPKLLDQVCAKMRILHYSKRTERAYVDWIKRFIFFQGKTGKGDILNCWATAERAPV